MTTNTNLHDVLSYFPLPKTVTMAALLLVSLFCFAASGAEEVSYASDAANVFTHLIGWVCVLALILMLRGFVVAALTVAMREFIATASIETLGTLAKHLTKRSE